MTKKKIYLKNVDKLRNSKFIYLEDTVFFKKRIVAINKESINIVEKYNSRKLALYCNNRGSYSIDASISNLQTLFINNIINRAFIIKNGYIDYKILEEYGE